jgi:hypothetical protein
MADHTMRLPGTVPIALADWLQRDEVFGAQMALRDRLVAEKTAAVHAMAEGCRPAAEEVLATVLGHLGGVEGNARTPEGMRRPDGVVVPTGGPPLIVAGRLVQEDLVVLEKPEGAAEHVLTGAILCFPSNWTLAQKFGMPLARIHAPVEHYDEAVAHRVQRLFDAIRPEAPLMRANMISYAHADLHSPRAEFDRHRPEPGEIRYLRVERQVLLRLPVTRAVVFSIHTHLIRPEALSDEKKARLAVVRPDLVRV